jgi:hypothetical protein
LYLTREMLKLGRTVFVRPRHTKVSDMNRDVRDQSRDQKNYISPGPGPKEKLHRDQNRDRKKITGTTTGTGTGTNA